MFHDLDTWIPNDILLRNDKIYADSGIEVRVPFLDQKIIEDYLMIDGYKKYHGTNFIIECYLNDNFIGGSLNNLVPRKGYGTIHNKTDIFKISKVTKGTCYLIFCYIKNIKEKKSLL